MYAEEKLFSDKRDILHRNPKRNTKHRREVGIQGQIIKLWQQTKLPKTLNANETNEIKKNKNKKRTSDKSNTAGKNKWKFCEKNEDSKEFRVNEYKQNKAFQNNEFY